MRNRQQHTTATRDDGLRRVARATRGLQAAAVGLLGLATAVAAGSFPGRSARATGRSGTAQPPARHVTLPTAHDLNRRHHAHHRSASPQDSGGASQSTSDPGLQPPPVTPVPTEAPAGPVSGGS